MKPERSIARIACALGVFVFAFFAVHANAYASDEVIDNFTSSIVLQADGAIQVTEIIEYNFGDNQKHGIFRDIPLTAVDGPDIGISVNSVKDGNGQPYHYVESTNNSILDLKIGEANKTVSGVKTYVIDYTVTNVIRPFEDHDELYWNVTGNGWPVGIKKASASVFVPGPAVAEQVDCFTGPAGSTDKQCTPADFPGKAIYFTTKPLEAGEGLTIVLGIPLGIVNDTVIPSDGLRSTIQDITVSGTDWLFLLIPLLFIISLIGFIVFAISRIFSKPGYKGPVVVAYEPPNGLAPIDVGTILDRSVDRKDVSSIILDLAVRGYLKIRYTVKEIPFWPDKKDFELVKLKEGSSLKHPGEKILFDMLFDKRSSILVSDLMEKALDYEDQIKDITAKTEEHLRTAGYFDISAKEKADKMNKQLAIISTVLVVGTVIVSFLTAGLGILLMFPIVAFVIIRMMISGRLTNQLTPKGADAQAKIAGFQEFLKLTEMDKLKLLNAPKLEPEMFEKFLPYAMVLGAEEQWATKFEGLYKTAPTWYEDANHGAFSSMLLTHNLAQLNNSWSQVVTSSVPHSSSGFSGGSSGGGSGGGGGGSW
ncbi:MAG: DUF2207 domain-containing protein [Patescibacteria group bacterium]|jgi:uncharacterized membrane protein